MHDDTSHADDEALGADAKTTDSIPKLILKASARWVGVVVPYILVGTVVSWLCFLLIAVPLWSHGPTIAGARVGGPAAILVLVIMLLHPCGLISLLYVVGFPVVFAILGHHQGMMAGLRRLVRGRGPQVARWLVTTIWPSIDRAAGVRGREGADLTVRSLVKASNEKGTARRVLRWTLSAAKVDKALTVSGFLERTQETPETARSELVSNLSQALEDLVEPHRVRVLLLACGGVVAVTALSPLWMKLLPG